MDSDRDVMRTGGCFWWSHHGYRYATEFDPAYDHRGQFESQNGRVEGPVQG